MAGTIAFSGNPLDRAGNQRHDAAWVASLRAGTHARVLPMWKMQPLLVAGDVVQGPARLGFVDGSFASGLGADDSIEVFLGLRGEQAYFARDISAIDDPLAGPLANAGVFQDARKAASCLSADESAILAQAKSLIDWHKRHGFCANCGHVTTPAEGGYRRMCSHCGTEHFPRTDPAVIMLVTRGGQCLLGRNRRFSAGFYSTLAGFVEPGETIEEAVAREIFEEAGLRISRVRYFASQPWPFPSSLMIGCFAEADNSTIAIDGQEIVAAEWFDHAVITKLIDGTSTVIGLPRRDAIAFHLLSHWAENGPWS
ncbi:MAG TPA: NAD(+) diphosphatase [Micropepsaceae bacterium]|nr:NAD(+) diphosphatase [Micropepsaceae bacterium]